MEIINPNKTFNDIETIIRNAYSNNPEYENTIFVLGYNEMRTIAGIRHKNPGKKVVVIQLEQLYQGSRWWNRHAFGILDRADAVWDYDQSNIEFLAKYGVHADHWKIPATLPTELSPVADNPTTDILFYGSLNERRIVILNKIKYLLPNTNLVVLTNCWGDELKQHISNSKIILNLHYYELGLQEIVRMIYPIMNNRCVLSETSKNDYLKHVIYQVDKEDIPKMCQGILESGSWKEKADLASLRYKGLE